MTGATAPSTWSRPSALERSPYSSARSTSKRAKGTARSSSARIASGPWPATKSAGSPPARERHDPQPRAADELRRAHHRLAPRAVGVEAQQHRRGELAQLVRLLAGQRGPHQPDRVAHARLVQRDDVRVALRQHHRPRLGRGRARQVVRVHVACPCGRGRPRRSSGTWAAGSSRTARAPKPQHPPLLVGQREHDARRGSGRRRRRLATA